ncbi:uncharacterized protein LOC106085482 [Stomoxys calcitrans]|uniref:Uncharacterized protein n=1 Tax=Stomoxys calcitrans TaxID=35570 RepID=A0A1I8PQG8_STOCA|nr:uncharacterized protein LOC106085482 [Stomoxys calcitrans]
MEEMVVESAPLAIPEDDLKSKDDGMHLIIEPGCTLAVLREYMNMSCLSEKCQFVQTTDEIQEICQEFITILRKEELNLDEITTLFVAACMCYFVNAKPENYEWRSQLLQKTFQYVDTLSPMHLHIATKRLWNALKTDEIDYVFNLITICHQLSSASETGRAIAICLIWTILFKITETRIQMYCFHEFSELMKILNELDDQLLLKEENLRIVYILIQSVGFLVNAIVFGQNDDFKKAGYRNYFSYTKRELEKLKKYAERLSGLLKVNISAAENNYELRMTISEYINVNIIGVLQEKISEMQSSK